MDIKKRIQELSLDQKAKLYFMGLVRKGIIDRLPEDPKAAYIRDMMDKENPKMDPAIRSDFDDPMFEYNVGYYVVNDKSTGKEVARFAKLKDPSGALRDAKRFITRALDRYEKNEKERYERYALMYKDNPEDMDFSPNPKPEYEIGTDIESRSMEEGMNLKEIATQLGYLNEEENYQNLPKPDEISLSYTDPGFRFYGMYLYKDGKRFAKISYEDRATKYLKNLGVETEVPRRFDTDILDKIKQEIEALGIKGDYDAAMDVS